jgi:hypothetical protein
MDKIETVIKQSRLKRETLINTKLTAKKKGIKLRRRKRENIQVK